MSTNGVRTEEIKLLNKCDSQDERLMELQGRTKRCCCSYCGGELVLRRITIGSNDTGRIEIFCSGCERIEFGVEKEIYQAADYYADCLKFDYYPDLDDSERKKRMNRAKVCEIIQWGCKNLGLVNKEGFTNQIEMDASLMGKNIILSESDLIEIISEGGEK